MRKHTFSIIIALMTVTLLGILLAQFYWVKNAYEVSMKEFGQSVNMAMNDVVRELKKDELRIFVDSKFGDHMPHSDSLKMRSEMIISGDESVIILEDHVSDSLTYDVLMWTGDEDESIFDESISRQIVSNENDVIRQEVSIKTIQRGDSILSDTIFSGIEELEIENIFHEIIHEYSFVGDRVDARLESVNLDSLSRSKLKIHGIEDDFELAVTADDGKEILEEFSSESFDPKEGLGFSKMLFQNDMIKNGNQLLINFPSTSNFIFGKMKKVIILGLLLTLLMISTFYFTIRTILRQKKVSVMKNDFINNMTHEFKTPIATINLALDSLKHQDARADADKIDQFTGIIRKENERLHRQVERVLQIAQFESESPRIDYAEIDLCSVVVKSIDQVRLLLEENKGTVNYKANPEEIWINGDEELLNRMIVNLLDNAIKYSENSPEINVDMRKEGQFAVLLIKDRGIGMSKSAVNRIFENFYREESGNIHQTKGFGLGMSYVKMIVEKHQGDIKVLSDKGLGTSVEVRIPVLK